MVLVMNFQSAVEVDLVDIKWRHLTWPLLPVKRHLFELLEDTMPLNIPI
jgi:hypothetical protein